MLFLKNRDNDDTESKLILLTKRQVSKLGEELLGQGITTLLGKPADQEDGTLVFQRTIFSRSESGLLLYRGRGGREDPLRCHPLVEQNP